MHVARIPVITALVVSVFSACNFSNKAEQEFEYIPLSQYKVDPHVIIPNSPVRIIAYSGGKISDEKARHYFQFIVADSTGDTVRVLAPLINIPGDGEKGTYTTPDQFDGAKGVLDAIYVSQDSTATAMLNQASPASSELVIRNKSLHIFAGENYKTTTGILQFSTKPW